MTDPRSLDDILGHPSDPENTDPTIQNPTIQAAREQVDVLNRSLMMIGDSLITANRSLHQQIYAMESAIAALRAASQNVNQSLETAQGNMSRLFVTLGMEYEDYFKMNGMDRAKEIARRKMHDSEFECIMRKAREERRQKRARRGRKRKPIDAPES
uniref:Uncharacterized protein n=1 Tax=Candidatus Kentrum sp. TUN TaxID=2126343 RepID=A0A450ZMG0_9GAMM|nr:MAG: hypothetical protein BECKTUN1418F_GA0071002_10613 [Candidatus Kentron sp. TUN]VFK61132.1 MAG: hypothetical protein BECKTUN1418E_GA0071001_10623 [Candidatus Kentron sp. TUN]